MTEAGPGHGAFLSARLTCSNHPWHRADGWNAGLHSTGFVIRTPLRPVNGAGQFVSLPALPGAAGREHSRPMSSLRSQGPRWARFILLVVVVLWVRSELRGQAADDLLARLRSSPGAVLGADGRPAPESIRLERRWSGSRLRAVVRNTGSAPVRIREVVLGEFAHGLAGDTPIYAEGFQMLSQTGGTLAALRDLGAYTDRAHYRIPEPAGYRSVYGLLLLSPRGAPHQLLAFASCRRFAGRFDVSSDRLRVVMDTENLELGPRETWTLEEFQAAAGADRAALLDGLGLAINRQHPRLKHDPVPAGWCSWYCFGPEVKAENIEANLGAIAAGLPAFRYIQIDDGYQPQMGDWLETGPSFGGGVQTVLKRIRERGFEPAIWVAPFVAGGGSKLFREHPEWFVRGPDGRPLRSDTVSFGGWRLGPWYCLDGTHPGAQRHLEEVFRTMRREWGVTYFKLDANFWGTIHGGRFHDPRATRVEAYRRGMAAVLRGAGDAFVLGCNHPLWPSLGLIHGSRSSMDIDRSWGSITSIGRENLLRGWQNGRLWWNDPDCVLLTGKLPLNEVRFHATLIAATGGMLLSGDDLTRIPADRLAMLRTLVPPAGRAARFEEGGFEIGRLPMGKGERLFLFNWGDEPASRAVKLIRRVRVRDEWEGTDLGVQGGTFTVTLPPHSASLLRTTPE